MPTQMNTYKVELISPYRGLVFEIRTVKAKSVSITNGDYTPSDSYAFYDEDQKLVARYPVRFTIITLVEK